MTDILPCPRCGNVPEVVSSHRSYSHRSYNCHCPCFRPRVSFIKESAAINDWNNHAMVIAESVPAGCPICRKAPEVIKTSKNLFRCYCDCYGLPAPELAVEKWNDIVYSSGREVPINEESS